MTNTQPIAIFILRVTLGVTLLAHGLLLKILTFGLAGTMGFFGSLGYPPLLGAVVALAESAAGIALILGIWVRPVALLLLPILLGATWQHLGNGWLFSRPGGGWEYPATLVMLALAQAGLGAGAFAMRAPVLAKPRAA